MVNSYHVVGFADGNVSMPQGLEVFHRTGTVVHLKSETDIDRLGFPHHLGIKVTIDLKGLSIDEAIVAASGTADFFLGGIAATSGTHAGWFRPWVAYDTTPDTEDREFVQFIYDKQGFPKKELRVLNSIAFAHLLEKSHQLPENEFLRLADSMHWYNAARTEDIPLHEYTSLWTGLESLEPMLRQHQGVKPELGRCSNKNCGVTFVRQEAVGIKALASRVAHATFKHLRDVRVWALHGARRVPDANDEAERNVDDLDTMLRSGIGSLLGMEMPRLEGERVRSRRLDYSVKIRAVLHGTDPTTLGVDGQEPYFELRPTGNVGSPQEPRTSLAHITHATVPSTIQCLEFPEHYGIHSVEVDPEIGTPETR